MHHLYLPKATQTPKCILSKSTRHCNSVIFSINVAKCGKPVKDSSLSRTYNSGRVIRASLETSEIVSKEDNRTVQVGDLVSVHFKCKTPNGVVLQSSEGNEPLTFEAGAGDIMGNPLFRDFDLAIRGLQIGNIGTVKSRAAEPDPDLIFEVPKGHEEILRLEKENEGPLLPGTPVVLANGNPGLVTEILESAVVIDVNHPLAGTELIFEVEVVSIER